MALNERFSDDMLLIILSWLPTQHAARVRVVCKRWHALTSEHHFSHTSFSRNTGHSIAGFFLSDQIHDIFSYNPLPRATASINHVNPDLSFIPSTPAIDKGQIYVTSSCNGLLICSRPNYPVVYKPTCYTCNPITRKFIKIDVPEGTDHFPSLAYDPSKSRHYQIVTLGNHCIHLYSSQTRSWRIARQFDHSNNPFSGLRCYHSVFWNSSLVWVVSHHLIRFVIDEEQVIRMPMPQTPEGWICAYVGESGGRLQMIGFTQQERLTGFLDVLEMQEHCLEWSVLYRVDLRRVKELYPDIRRTEPEFRWVGLRFSVGAGKMTEHLALWPIYVVRGARESGRRGALLFSVPGKILCYNTDDQTISLVREVTMAPLLCTYQYSWYHFSPYSPGLFAL